MDTSTVQICLATTGALLLVNYLWSRLVNDRKYPAGPLCFPVLGNLPQMILAGKLSSFLSDNRKRFGNVFTIELGGEKRVVVSGYEAMHKLLVKNADNTSNRTIKSMPKHYEKVAVRTPGIMWAPFPQWKTLRSFTINTLREEGMGKSALEPKIVAEIESYIAHYITPHLGKQVNLMNTLPHFNLNIISQMLSSTRMEYSDPLLKYIVDTMAEIIDLTGKATVLNNIPFSQYLPLVKREEYISNEVMIKFAAKHVADHLASLDTSSEPRDLLDRFLAHSKSLKGSTDPAFSDGNASIVSLQLYIAGTDTTSQAIKWALLFLCLHPDVQIKARREITDALGISRQVEYKDRLGMPYVEAFLLESLRKANIASTALPHVTEIDIVVDGKVIPADTELMFNMASVLDDGEVFEEPQKFHPARYLTGDVQLKKQRTVAFGMGRRACPGEPLARMEYFLFIATILQKYEIALAPGSDVTDERAEGFVNSPKPFELIFNASN